jgi:hypothetical protein
MGEAFPPKLAKDGPSHQGRHMTVELRVDSSLFEEHWPIQQNKISPTNCPITHYNRNRNRNFINM